MGMLVTPRAMHYDEVYDSCSELLHLYLYVLLFNLLCCRVWAAVVDVVQNRPSHNIPTRWLAFGKLYRNPTIKVVDVCVCFCELLRQAMSLSVIFRLSVT